MIEKYSNLLEREIKKKKYGKQPDSLYEPIRYLMSLGGKRLRPMLVLLSYSLYKKDVKSILPYAVAVEAFHNFTLMHDDIMDNAPLRRGQATVHEKWNVSTAILSGDVMLIKVYEMLLGIQSKYLKKVFQAFNKCASEVCEGQQWDMEFETTNTVTEPAYIHMIKLKTAVLLGFSMELGALLAGASDKDCKSLRDFGINIGLGFQLKDDLLDAYADSKKFGKQVGGDIIANKKTFLLIKALELAIGQHREDLTYWLTASEFEKEKKVKAVKEIYDALSIPALAEKKVNAYFRKSFSQLKKIKCSEDAKLRLVKFTELLMARES